MKRTRRDSNKSTDTRSKSMKVLDEKHPQAGTMCKIPGLPDHLANPLSSWTDLPTLPIINQAYEPSVFTHAGFADAKYKPSTRNVNYEHLEFYGDASVELIATRLIHHRYPDILVGQQAKLREALVNNKIMSSFSIAYGFDKRVRRAYRSYNELQETKLTADVFEAYVAAVILSDVENGFRTAEKWLTQLWSNELMRLDTTGSRLISAIDQNWKEVLQKRVGGRSDDGRDVRLEYRTESTAGQQATIAVYLHGWGRNHVFLGRGEGLGKTEAGMRAAQDAIVSQEPLLVKLEAQKKVYDDWRREEKAKAAAAAAAEA